MHNEPLDLSAIRARLAQSRGRQYWRSLEELADTPAFRAFLHREFPPGASEWTDPIGRRRFLKLMGASLALAGLTACNHQQPREKILPYVQQPEQLVPGKPIFYATAVPRGGYAAGVLVESHMGRPTKVEGNPDHPASLGATDALAQATMLTLYDPDRSQVVTNVGRISTWDAFLNELSGQMQGQRGNQGAGLRILTETVTSPTLAAQMQELLQAFPSAKWHQYDPVGRDNTRAGARMAFGRELNTVYRFDRAARILSLDADFLFEDPGRLRYARDFINGRRVSEEHAEMNRLYVVESTPTITGAMADHRLPLRASQIEGLARAVAQALGVDVGGGAPAGAEIPAEWVAAVARDLQEHRGASLVLAGERQPPIVHAMAHAMNAALGSPGATLIYTDPVEANPADQIASLRELMADIDSGAVSMLVIVGGNPVFTAPADLAFAERMNKVPLRIHMGVYADETAELSHWHIPQTHEFEAWSDARAFDGTVTIMQPLIAPLYDGHSPHELIAALVGQSTRSGYEIVRAYWEGQRGGGDFETFWRRALHDGMIADTALPETQASLNAGFAAQAQPAPAAAEGQFEIVFRPDPTIWDGRFANNGWLQELPKPITLLTWDNAALISPATAERLGLVNEDLVELRYGDRLVQAPIWIQPGHPDEAVTVHVGYGRSRAGQVGTGTGFNAYLLRRSDAPWFAAGLQMRKLGARYDLATTQSHFNMEGRHPVRVGTLEEYHEHPDFVHEMAHEPPPELTLYEPYPYEGNKWGMAIDLNACIGCNACIAACQAENNIPIVGKEQVRRSREMHWLRVDRYYEGDLENPETYFQPLPCMHCENAPCEIVCPVAATSHSAEGLNEMTYNRCVGTRYCSNNCPYKVRRFNYLQYTRNDVPVLKLLQNPDVTVRDRGVMEKCTYCVQRINAARIEAKKDGRPIADGEVVTACQQVCPTQAIVFGNINDPNSQVAKLKADHRNYGLLADLNTRPRTSYLARLRNPNPAIKTE